RHGKRTDAIEQGKEEAEARPQQQEEEGRARAAALPRRRTGPRHACQPVRQKERLSPRSIFRRSAHRFGAANATNALNPRRIPAGMHVRVLRLEWNALWRGTGARGIKERPVGASVGLIGALLQRLLPPEPPDWPELLPPVPPLL